MNGGTAFSHSLGGLLGLIAFITANQTIVGIIGKHFGPDIAQLVGFIPAVCAYAGTAFVASSNITPPDLSALQPKKP